MEIQTLEQVPAKLNQLSASVERIEQLLLRNAVQAPEKRKPKYLTVTEAASLLSISTTSIYALARTKAIPSYKKQHRLYFSEEELTQWLDAGKREAVTSLAYSADGALLSANKKRIF